MSMARHSVLTLALLYAAADCRSQPASASPLLYEWREYRAADGKVEELHARFRDHTLRLQARHGITNVACFTAAGGRADSVHVLVAYPDGRSRERSWAAFVQDPEWQRVRRATDANGRLVEAVREFPLSATRERPAGPRRAAGRVVAVRTPTSDRRFGPYARRPGRTRPRVVDDGRPRVGGRDGVRETGGPEAAGDPPGGVLPRAGGRAKPAAAARPPAEPGHRVRSCYHGLFASEVAAGTLPFSRPEA